jgi:hypothetical protein
VTTPEFHGGGVEQAKSGEAGRRNASCARGTSLLLTCSPARRSSGEAGRGHLMVADHERIFAPVNIW